MIPYLESPGDARCIEKQVARPVFKIEIFFGYFQFVISSPGRIEKHPVRQFNFDFN